MDGYLVIAAYVYDDIPLRMFPSLREATALADDLAHGRERPQANVLCPDCDVNQNLYSCAKILRFVGGVPVGPVTVHHTGED